MNRLLAGGALAVFFAAMLAVAIGSIASEDGGKETTIAQTSISTTTRAATTTTVPKAKPVKLTGAGAYDPEGDGHENDDLAPLAVDGNAATFWKTERYRNFSHTKKGVGLLLDAGRSGKLSRVLVSTDAAGSSAQIEVGNVATGPFRTVSPDRPLNGTTSFKLTKGAAGRYVVVWITALPQGAGEAHVTEVRAER